MRRQLGRLVRAGAADLVCEAVAQRLAARNDGPLADVVAVQVVRGRYRVGKLLRRRQGTVVGAGLRQARGAPATMSAGPLKVLRKHLLVEAPATPSRCCES